MKIHTSLTAAGAALVLGTTGALPAPIVASAHSTTHTLKFISATKKSIMFSKASGGSQDTDVNTAGKTVGFDMIYFVARRLSRSNTAPDARQMCSMIITAVVSGSRARKMCVTSPG